MKPLSLSAIACMTGGRLRGEDVVCDAIVTDTRALPDRGTALFVALKGERFDGHDHVAMLKQGETGVVAAALVSRELDIALPQVVVADTERALAAFAAALQRERDTRVLAITGSNGKTSVKALLLAILQQVPGKTAYANPGNRNNQIGLPLAVIDAPGDAAFAIYEMGAGQPGDISYLTAIARPDAALVNNIAPAHLERMGSLLGVADTKAAIYDALPADGVAAINADDAFAPYFAERAHGRHLVRFGLEASADITAHDIQAESDGSRFTLVTPQGNAPVTLAMPGRHNVMNALAAAALALGAGIGIDAIATGLSAARPVAGRLATHQFGNGVVLVDDSYNANPGSLNAAIETLAASDAGERWLVLGDMRELGKDAEALHAEAGRRAKAAGLTRLYALGALSAAAAQAFNDGGRQFASHAALAHALRADLDAFVGATGVANASARNEELAPRCAPTRAGLRVLVKGSRGSAMDRIVDALLTGEIADHAA